MFIITKEQPHVFLSILMGSKGNLSLEIVHICDGLGFWEQKVEHFETCS